jgi:hypothetical protein
VVGTTKSSSERGVGLAFETDDLSLPADSLLELADLATDVRRARAPLDDALRVGERKGNVVVARQARERLAMLS